MLEEENVDISEIKYNTDKLPWKPWVTGFYGASFGPISAGIITYLNLKRMGHRDKGYKIFSATMIISFLIIAFLIYLPDDVPEFYGRIFQALVSVLFPMLQTSEFKLWLNEDTLGNSPRNGWSALGWGFLGMIAFIIMAYSVGYAYGLMLAS
ncbi:MAG: hypothetical protein OCD01_11225 [Fibrobacterales bacterium]